MDGFAGFPLQPTHSVCRMLDHQEGKRRVREREKRPAKSISGRNARCACASVTGSEIPSKHIARHTGALRRTERTEKTRERICRRTGTSWDTRGLEHIQDEFQLRASVESALSRTGPICKAYEEFGKALIPFFFFKPVGHCYHREDKQENRDYKCD